MTSGRLVRAAGAAALAGVLAGCGGLPSEGPVEQGLQVGADDFAPIHLRFDAPQPGATPQQIVQGFLTASWSADEDYAAGRAYLTREAAASWEPRRGVTVYSDAASLRLRVDQDRAEVEAPVVARIDGTGRYQVAAPGEQDQARLQLARVGGEWRIAHLPDDFGIWLSRFYFDRAFRPLQVTYADQFDRTLLGDHRWLPLGSGLATTLARAQLGEVPGYLQGAVVSGFPPGTRLAVDSVPIVDKVARIELTEEALVATPDQRRAAWAQMLRTMRQLPGVTAVELSVDGSVWQIVGVDGVPASVGALGFTEPEPLVPAVLLREGRRLQAVDLFGWLRGGENQRAVDAALPEVDPRWEAIAVSGELDRLAAVDRGRTTLMWWSRGRGVAQVRLGSGLTEPAIDRRGRIWVAGVDDRGRPRVWWMDGLARAGTPPVALSMPNDDPIVAVKPAPGARRLAVATKDASGQVSVRVGGLTLGQGTSPVSLGRPWLVAAGLDGLRDLTWTDDASLGLLAGRTDVTPIVQPLGGPPQPLTPVKGARQMATSGGVKGIVVVTDEGTVWRRVGATWQQRGHVGELVVPGA